MSTKNIIHLILFTFFGICSSQDIYQKPNPIVFDNPDLVLDLETDSGSIILEAYKFKMNDQIIQNKRHDDYAKLKWYSLGYPELAYSWNKKNESALFKFTSQRFEARVEMLTSKHKSVLRNLIKDMYNISVKDNQIINLALSKFECELSFHQDLEKISIKGKVNKLNSFPLKLEFNEPVGSKNRNLFEDRLKDIEESSNFEIACDVSSRNRLFNTTLTLATSIQNSTSRSQIFIEDKLEPDDDNKFKSLEDKFNKTIHHLYSELDKTRNFKKKFIDLVKILSTVDSIFNQISVNVTVKRTLDGHSSWRTLFVLPDGNLASSSEDSKIKIWNLKDGTIKRTLMGHSSWIRALVLLPNGDLASGSEDHTIKIWNINDGTTKRTLTGHSKSVQTLTILPNGDLASGSEDNTIKIWNTDDGTVKRTLTGHSSWVRSLAVLPNGDLASGSCDNTVKIWSTKDRITDDFKHLIEHT